VIIMHSLLSNRSSIVDFITMEMCSTKHVDGSGLIGVKHINKCEHLKNATLFGLSLTVKEL
jgi:hypothetical protein